MICSRRHHSLKRSSNLLFSFFICSYFSRFISFVNGYRCLKHFPQLLTISKNYYFLILRIYPLRLLSSFSSTSVSGGRLKTGGHRQDRQHHFPKTSHLQSLFTTAESVANAVRSHFFTTINIAISIWTKLRLTNSTTLFIFFSSILLQKSMINPSLTNTIKKYISH